MDIIRPNIRSYKKLIRDSKVGDRFYLNAISCSNAMIDYTKELIKVGKIAPVSNELDKIIVADEQYRFYLGDAIAPQMTYEIIK